MPSLLFYLSNIFTKAKLNHGLQTCFVFLTLLSYMVSLPANAFTENELASLPEPVSNNAVTRVSVNNKDYLLSFSGLGKNKSYQDVHNKAFIYDVNANQWQSIAPVPMTSLPANKAMKGLMGRLASVATSIKNKAYIFGGYTVAKDHSEVSVPDVYAYDVINASYTKLASMPVPVDDSVALPYNNRYIYLVSGWHNDGNVNLVQLYDVETNTWQQASPFPGKPVFGQAGGIVGHTLVVCDGVRIDVHLNKRRSYAAEASCYLGKIDPQQPSKIAWQSLPHPTGKSRYRMAAVGIDKQQKIVFIGGSDNPYNYNGMGYNGLPSSPDNGVWIYDIEHNNWQVKTTDKATMDHRGLLLLADQLLTVGGMGHSQEVLNSINQHGNIKDYFYIPTRILK
jgi:N-acetylneuraminic acid mutarotase